MGGGQKWKSKSKKKKNDPKQITRDVYVDFRLM